MKITFAHICDYASVSREGKLSVLGIFSAIRAPQLPYRHPQMFLAFELEFNYAEANRDQHLRIEIVDADGQKIFQAQADMKLAGPARIGDRPRLGQAIGINNLKFVRDGAYNVNFFMNEDLKHQEEFAVKVIKAAGTQNQPDLPLGPS